MSSEIDKKEFLKKIDKTAQELKAKEELTVLERDTKIDVLLYLKSNLSLVSSRTQLRESVISKILNKIDNDDEMTTSQLIKLLEVLDGAENEKMASILGVLKQQAQQNIQVNGATAGIPAPSGEREIPISPEDFHTAKRVYQFVDKAKKAEFSDLGDLSKE